MFTVYHDLKFSDFDYATIMFALCRQLREEQRDMELLPNSEGPVMRADALERLIHIFKTSGEFEN